MPEVFSFEIVQEDRRSRSRRAYESNLTREMHKLPKTCEHGSIEACSILPSKRS